MTAILPAAVSRIRLPDAGPSVLAFGAHFKGSVCIAGGGEALLSPNIGALDNADACVLFDETVSRMLDAAQVQAQIVAHDLHPDYYSTRAAIEFAASRGLPVVAVAHHHAHIAAVCAEHGERGAVLGLALDGVGLGPDGAAWGGELLQVQGAQCARLGHLRPLALPGGDRAAREPWRMAASVLHELGRNADIAARLPQAGAGMIATLLERNFRCPRTSSMGRVFDAAAGLLGLCATMQHEAEAAILLEQAAARHIARDGWPQAMPGGWRIERDGRLDLLPVLAALEDAHRRDGLPGVDAAAALFHATLVAALGAWVAQAAEASGLATVAWGGGCFLNTLLSRGLRQTIETMGIAVLAPERASPGDAGIALGQAWVAMHTLER